MNRDARRRLGQETVEILTNGVYRSATGKTIRIKAQIDACVAGTKFIHETTPLSLQPAPAGVQTRLEVTTESSLEASKRLCDLLKRSQTFCEPRVMCLNFASAHNPGGGFLGGSQAQEESLARCSGLYASQTKGGSAMYDYNGRLAKGNVARPHTLYSDCMLVSPNVPVFRDENSGALLDEVYNVTFLSAPAPNAGATLKNFTKHGLSEDELWKLIDTAMETRLNRILAVAQQEGTQALVLGAYGCGVFRNKPSTVARICHTLLQGPFLNVFPHVVFAVYAKDDKDPTFQTFYRVLTQ